jgi:TRAP-type transport system periplasmic protein
MKKAQRLKVIVCFCLLMVPAIFLLTSQFAVAKTFKLTHNNHMPPFSPPGQASEYWAKKLNEMSGGRLEVTVYPGGSLLSGEETYRGVQSSVCNSSFYVVDSREGFKLNLIMGLPFMGWPPEQKATQVYKQLLDESKAMQDEWKGVTPIGIAMMQSTSINTTKKAVRVPADLKGMKIMGVEFMLNATMQAAGATPVQLDVGEMATSINTGLIDGIMNHMPAINVFGALELTKYHTIFGESGMNVTPAYLIINTSVLNRLPSDLKKIVIDSGKIWEDKFIELSLQDTARANDVATKQGHTIINLNPEEIKVWYDLVKGPVHEAWLKDAENAGLPGREIYNRALNLAKEYQ